MLAYAPPRDRAANSPSALTIVIALHGLALAALMLAKPELVLPEPIPDTEVYNVPLPKPEPVPEIDPAPMPDTPISDPIFIEPLIEVPQVGPTIQTVDLEGLITPPIELGGNGAVVSVEPPLVRTEPRLRTPAHRLEPPYPSSKRRFGEEATLRLRLAIDPVGRVTSVTPLGSYDSAFLNSAERHILRHWRYTPAMLGDEAIASEVTISLQFKLED